VNNHLLIAPIVVPLVAGALQLLVGDRRPRVTAAIGGISCLTLLGVSIALMMLADGAQGGEALAAVYRIGDWPAPFGIVLVADRLSALMTTLTAVLAIASSSRWAGGRGSGRTTIRCSSSC